MVALRGNSWRIGFGKQIAEGTLIAPVQHFRFLQGSSVDPNVKVTNEYEGDGTIDISFLNKDSSVWKGKLSFYARSTDIGFMMNALMGTASETLKAQPSGATATQAVSGGTVATGAYHVAWAFLYGQQPGIRAADLTVTTTTNVSTIGLASLPTDAAATGVRFFFGAPGGAVNVYGSYIDFAYIPGTTTSVTYTGSGATIVPSGGIITSLTGGLHYFQPQSVLDFFTTEYGQTTAVSNQIMERLADTVFTDVTIEADPNRPVKVTVGFIAKYAQAVASLQAAVFDAGTPLNMANSVFLLDGVANSFVSKFKFNYKLTVDESLFYTHLWPETFLLEKREVMIDYELLFQDASKFHQFLSGGTTTNPTAGTTIDNAIVATGALDLRLSAGGGLDMSNGIGITVPNVAYSVKAVTPSLDGKPFMQPVSAFAVRSSVGANLFTSAVRNSQATAY